MDENDENEEMIKVLYNNCYGGWGLSDNAKRLYKLRQEKAGDDIDIWGEGSSRNDPILIQIYEELGVEFNGRHSKADITYIPKKYKKYYRIVEYDGLEGVEINYIRYNFDIMKENTKSILISNITNDDKISLLNKMFLDPIKKKMEEAEKVEEA